MQLRDSNIEKLSSETFDALVIGGGINGASAAAALSGKGVKVGLIDRGDFAGETSMHSSISSGAASNTWRAMISPWYASSARAAII